jgi:hypothetical protein
MIKLKEENQKLSLQLSKIMKERDEIKSTVNLTIYLV